MKSRSFSGVSPGDSGPFSLNDPEAYQGWRERKLARYPVDADALRVEIENPSRLRKAEVDALLGRCRMANMAVYDLGDTPDLSRRDLTRLARQLGLRTLDRDPQGPQDRGDGITAIRVPPPSEVAEVTEMADGGGDRAYVPYTNRALRWHTDGYYNASENVVRSVLMHCVSPAERGGANYLCDPELMYIALRDENPKHVAALMAPDAMTIPANVLDGRVLRPARTGPVFTTDAHHRVLHTRYTARKRHIEWKDDAATREAVQFLERWLREPSPAALQMRLTAGQGILCNNVLHARDSFSDDPATGRSRLVWRVRYRERIPGT